MSEAVTTKFTPTDRVKTPMGEAVILYSRQTAKTGLEYFVRGRRTVPLLGLPTEITFTDWWREDQLEQV